MSSTTSDRSSSTASSTGSRWQDALQAHCRKTNMRPPVWNILSDRRGGRTAWSSTVTIEGHSVPARYWYDGQYVNNAKEDAAEVALQRLALIQRAKERQQQQSQAQGQSSQTSSPTSQGSSHQQQRRW